MKKYSEEIMSVDDRHIVIGSRDSALAIWQANYVADALRQIYPEMSFQILGIKTKGDKIIDRPLPEIGDKGLFTKELESALLEGQITMAVHSAKDLPTELPDSLAIGAVCKRAYPGDVLISQHNVRLADLRSGANIGTSSLRRRAQLLHYRQDLQLVDMRGNLPTRLRKLKELDLDAIVLAYAGVERLGLQELITEHLPFDICLPAPGQGAIIVECLAESSVLDIVASINDQESRATVEAERAFMQRLEGGCQVPMGAWGRLQGTSLTLAGIVLDTQGKNILRQCLTGLAASPQRLGIELAEALLRQGAAELLQQSRQGLEYIDK